MGKDRVEMRTNNLNHRAALTSDNYRSLFLSQLEYYRCHNVYPVSLFGHRVLNIYKNINVQVLITNRCNARCAFCIEKDNISWGPEINPALVLDEVLHQYTSQGILPHVSITGGEPTLYPDRVHDVIAVCEKYGVKKLNLNTNGLHLDKIIKIKNLMINLSFHHFPASVSKNTFGSQSPMVGITDYSGLNLQCVLTKDNIGTIEAIREYMDFFGTLHARGFSFRGMSLLDNQKDYSKELLDYNQSQYVNIFRILDEISKSEDFHFVEQKIGDHYVFEIYKYKGHYVRFTYSDFSLLREIEEEERRKGFLYSRATVIKPDGSVYTGWTYNINRIK